MVFSECLNFNDFSFYISWHQFTNLFSPIHEYFYYKIWCNECLKWHCEMHFDAPSSFRKDKMISVQKKQWINNFSKNKILKIICRRVSPEPFSPFCSAGPERSRSLIMERWPSRSRRKSDPSEFEKSISTRKLHSAVKWAIFSILSLYSKAKFENRPNNKSSKRSLSLRYVVWQFHESTKHKYEQSPTLSVVLFFNFFYFLIIFLKDLFANFSNAIHFWKGRHSCKFFKLNGTKIRQKSSAELIGVLSSRCFCPQYIRTVSP